MKKSIVSKIAVLVCGLSVLFSVAGCTNENANFMTDEEIAAYKSVYEQGLTGSMTLEFVREFNEQADVKFRANIKFNLSYTDAPITVTNFVNLVQSGFYNAPADEKDNPLTLESIGSDYAVFGSKKYQIVYNEDGEEEKDDEGETLYEYKSVETEYTIKGEFKANGWKNNTIDFTKGNVLFMNMADTTKYDSAFCQFGITTGALASDTMKGSYAAFGWVTDTEVYRIDASGNAGSDLGATFDQLLSMYIGDAMTGDRDTVVKIIEIKMDGNYDLGETRKLSV